MLKTFSYQELAPIASTFTFSYVNSYVIFVTLSGIGQYITQYTVKILKFGTPQTIAIVVLKIEKFDVTLH